MERHYDITTEIIPAVKKTGGLIWTAPYYVNLIGVRDPENPNEWNDTFIYFYWKRSGELVAKQINEFTTDPGRTYLLSPCSSKGCAILAPGWHRRIWKLGYHKGYQALQQYSICKVYRDNDRDTEFDLNPNTIEEGSFGINLHRANAYSDAPTVGPHSAGCCVFRKLYDFNKFLETIKLSQRNCSQRYYSLALFNKDNFEIN